MCHGRRWQEGSEEEGLGISFYAIAFHEDNKERGLADIKPRNHPIFKSWNVWDIKIESKRSEIGSVMSEHKLEFLTAKWNEGYRLQWMYVW